MRVRSLSTPSTPDLNGSCPFPGSHYDPDSWAPISVMAGTERKSKPWVRGLLVSLPLLQISLVEGYTEGKTGRQPASRAALQSLL